MHLKRLKRQFSLLLDRCDSQPEATRITLFACLIAPTQFSKAVQFQFHSFRHPPTLPKTLKLSRNKTFHCLVGQLYLLRWNLQQFLAPLVCIRRTPPSCLLAKP